MKRELTKNEYYSMIMSLLFFKEQIKYIFYTKAINILDELIEIIRYYSQFAK